MSLEPADLLGRGCRRQTLDEITESCRQQARRSLKLSWSPRTVARPVRRACDGPWEALQDYLEELINGP